MDRQVSSNFTEIDLETVAPILEGKLDRLPPISSRLVRVFVSSTFSDMVEERNMLMEDLYPKLKHFCRDKYGLEFQIIDLRWGIRDEAQDDHTTIDFCIREIENCKKSSIGPSFVALLGQKYGYRPFPPHIQADELQKICLALGEDGKDIRILDQWFRLDTNVLPARYTLQPISSILKHYNDEDRILRDQDRNRWAEIFEDMRLLLRHGVELCVRNGELDEHEKEKYFVSVTEYEIARGMPEVEDCEKHCIAIVRTITDLEKQLHIPDVGKFIDLRPDSSIDCEAQALLRNLREKKIPSRFRTAENLFNMHIQWRNPPEGPISGQREYLDELCAILYQKLSMLITSAIWEIENLVSDNFVVEVIQHLSMCKTRCQIFRGREQTIYRIRKYLEHDPDQPLVVYGESGCGKTSVLAKSASLIHTWFSNKRPVLVLRFLGTSARSASIRLVLGSVCWQIAIMYGLDVTDIPSDYPSLVTHFHEILKVATEERPLFIFLDSLDQLSSSHRAHNLVWLPQKLPPNVRFIISSLPQEHNLLELLKVVVTAPTNYIQILPLGQSVSLGIIQEWLNAANRSLTEAQFDIVQGALSTCSLPLYTRLVFKEVCRWSSYDPPDETIIAETMKGVIHRLFDRVERQHGRTFVAYALSYITASKNGLSDAELEDVLSLDDTVLNDVFIHWIPPIRRIPPLLWPRLNDDLSNYIVQREANGIIVNWWYHRQFIAVAYRRYLSDPEHRKHIHSNLSDYFLGTWGRNAKPFEYDLKHMKALGLSTRVSAADRKVPEQPLWFGQSIYLPPRHGRVLYNLRKLSELPYHLTESGQTFILKQEVLFNYTWLHTKLSATSLQDVLSDFIQAIEAGVDDKEVQVLLNSLRVGGSYVNQNPDTLGFDLIGRLLPFYDKYPNIRNLLEQCDTSSRKHSALVPLFQCYESPSEVLQYILEDHTKLVLWLGFSQATKELISVSRDGTIAFWDLHRGERMRMMDISAINPNQRTKIMQSKNGHFLVCDSGKVDSPVHIFDLRNGQLLHEFGCRSPSQSRIFVVNNLMVRQKSIIDMRTGKAIRSLDDFTSSRQYVTVGLTNNERFILIGEEKFTNLFHLETGKLLAAYPAENVPSCFEFSPDDCRVYVGYSVDCLFKVFDIDPASDLFSQVILEYNYQTELPMVAFLEGPHYGRELVEISVCQATDTLVLLNIRRCNLVLLNLFTRESYIMNMDAIDATNETYLFGSCFSHDGRFVMAGETSYLHIWITSTGIHLSSIMIHSVYKFPFAVSPISNIVATGSNIHTAIKIWDIDKLQGREDKQLNIYENPIDMVAVARDTRLMYVKQYFPLGSGRGYRFLHHFGIDVWNLSTGTSCKFLPFLQYGQLLQMDVTPDGQHMALLLCNRSDTYMYILDTELNKVSQMIPHEGCHSFVLSHDAEFIATVAGPPVSEPELKLWSIPNGMEVASIPDGSNPIFLYDNSAMVAMSGHDQIVVYSFTELSQYQLALGDLDQLQLLPGHPHYIIATVFPAEDEQYARVRIIDITHQVVVTEFHNVAPTGIISVSKDGRVGIDGYLQLFDLGSGELLLQLEGDSMLDNSAEPRPLYSLICLTYDGCYAIWVKELSVNVCRIRDGKIIANMSTHEKVTCLNTLDYGYLIVIGREDGHVVIMKLLDPDYIPEVQRSLAQYRDLTPDVFITCESSFGDLLSLSGSLENLLDESGTTERSRSLAILDCMPLSEDTIHTFEIQFQPRPSQVLDVDLPYACLQVQIELGDKAQVPHAIINRGRRGTITDYDNSSLNSTPLGSPQHHRSRAFSDNEAFLGGHRGSLHEMLSPSNVIRSASGLFFSLTGSSENLARYTDSPKKDS